MPSAASAILLAVVAGALGQDVTLNTPQDLDDQYLTIFKTQNRNAASHLWTSFVIDRAANLPQEKFSRIFHGFCSVSGSPLPDDPHTMYKTRLNRATGNGSVTGVVRFCCWPCICDMNEHVRVDTKTVNLADGPKSFDWLVIGDPCKNPSKLQTTFIDPFSSEPTKLGEAAPELECVDGKLRGATYSDSDHVIIGMFFTDDESIQKVQPADILGPDGNNPAKIKDDPTFGFAPLCQMRKQQGYNSGMGLIFIKVAQITPIGAPLPLPHSLDQTDVSSIQRKVQTASRHALPPVRRSVDSSATTSVNIIALVAIMSGMLVSIGAFRAAHSTVNMHKKSPYLRTEASSSE